jgi:branched-chain amino acid transport system ATP-binding protein
LSGATADAPDLAGRLAGAAARQALELEGVGRRFGALVALEGVTLTVAPGERRAVLGSNGAGKTTLFNCITGDFPPTSGRVRFFGEDVTALPAHQRIRRGLRRTYQISLPFRGLTVADNIHLACIGATRGRFSPLRPRRDDPALEMTRRLAHAVHLDHMLEVPVGTLSHGALRQLEVGMALAGAPRLVLFDEPAAGLSPAERRELVEILRALPSHVGFVIIEHDLDVALRVADRVTVMHQGRIFRQDGTPDEIEADPEVQRIYLGGGRH